MAQIAAPRPLLRSNARTLLVFVAGALALGFALRLVEPGRIPALQNFFLVSGSLLIEAVPFVLIGAVVSSAIEVFVPVRFFERIARLPRGLQLPAAGLAGMAFPVCECGSVPVARRMASKGLTPAAAITFMLASPILNPIVIASTVVAYRGRDTLLPIVAGRLGLGLLAALAVGWVIAKQTPADLLRPRPDDEIEHHGTGRWRAFFGHVSGDFLFMGRYLVFGAAVAGAMQTIVPQSVLGSVAGTPVLDILVLMGLAFLLSLCSESDAFVAASFVQFGLGAQLAFLVFGPMVDVKLGFLYRGTFSKGFLKTVVLVVGAITLAGTLWVQVLAG